MISFTATDLIVIPITIYYTQQSSAAIFILNGAGVPALMVMAFLIHSREICLITFAVSQIGFTKSIASVFPHLKIL